MKDYFIADLHFGHQNIIQYGARPFNDIEQMNTTLIKNWNETVKKTDRVFVLGDFSLGPKENINLFSYQLNGRIILIKGNHERSNNQLYLNSNFIEVYSFPIFYKNKFILSHKPIEKLPNGLINIHGHIHQSNYGDNQHICVSVEHTNYRPISFKKLIKNMGM